jgi:hypothetical protein
MMFIETDSNELLRFKLIRQNYIPSRRLQRAIDRIHRQYITEINGFYIVPESRK